MEDDEHALAAEDRFEPPWEFRGHDMGRLLALSDGVFAFAMTLLVIGLVLPPGTKGGGVADYFQHGDFQTAIFTYVLTFFVIGMWWQGHHLVFGYIVRFDRVLVRLNSVFLVFMAILPFATISLNAAGNAPIGVGFFSVLQISAGLTLTLVWWYASGPGHLISKRFPKEWTHYLLRASLFMPIVFAASIPVAVYVGVTAAEVVWLLIFVFWFISRRHAKA
jgi:uncharacterized membrane protein